MQIARGPQCPHKVLVRGRQEGQSQRRMGEAVLLAVTMEEGATRLGHGTPRSWEKPKKLSQEPSEGTSPAGQFGLLILRPLR